MSKETFILFTDLFSRLHSTHPTTTASTPPSISPNLPLTRTMRQYADAPNAAIQRHGFARRGRWTIATRRNGILVSSKIKVWDHVSGVAWKGL